MCLVFLITRRSRNLPMALPPYPYQQPKSNNTLVIILVVVVLVTVLLVAGTVAFAFYAPTILRSSSSSNMRQDPTVTSATLACTGTCDLTSQFSDNTGQSRQIAQDGPGSWTLQRPSNAFYWDVEWQISLGSSGSISITLNTGYSLVHLQGPSSNQGSWSTASGQY